MFKLSIITINYNNQIGLEKTIESVVSQTFSNYEYIVIDGGSSDNSVEVIKNYHDKINYWISEKDAGIYDAMNKGIRKAKGEYCLFLNSGDYLIDETIISKVFSGNNTESILYGNMLVDIGNNNLKEEKLPKTLTLPFLFKHNIWHPATFIKKELFDKFGLYNEKYKIAADYDFFFLAIAIEKVTNIYIPLSIVVYNLGGISSNPKNLGIIEKERCLIHKTYLSDKEFTFLTNFKKFKNERLAEWLMDKPRWTKMFNWILDIYHKFRNY